MPGIDESKFEALASRLELANLESRELLAAMREERKRIEELVETTKTLTQDKITEVSRAELAAYVEQVQESVKDAERAVYLRFKKITDIVLGEDSASERTLLESYIQKLVREHVDKNLDTLTQRSAAMSQVLRGMPRQRKKG